MICRENIAVKKALGHEFPWTDDPILIEYRFCNIFREDDDTTVWIRENFREPYKDHPMLWFLLCGARYINYIPTLKKIGAQALLDFDTKQIHRTCDIIREGGDKVFTSAYMITTGGQTGISLMQRVVDQVLQGLYDHKDTLTRDFEACNSLEKACEILGRFAGFRANGGSRFMAYEVITDMRHTRYLENAEDIMTWCNVGIGAIRGIHRLRTESGSLEGVKFTNKQVWLNEQVVIILKWLKKRIEVIKSSLIEGADLSKWDKLEMRDIEHSLCEFDKYLRIYTGAGKTRAKYVPNRGY